MRCTVSRGRTNAVRNKVCLVVAWAFAGPNGGAVQLVALLADLLEFDDGSRWTKLVFFSSSHLYCISHSSVLRKREMFFFLIQMTFFSDAITHK